MKNIFDPVYRKTYMEGYSVGTNPNLELVPGLCDDAFSSGFHYGRYDYESRNGRLADGIPQNLLTDAVLDDFLLAGMLGMSIDTSGYTPFQQKIISKWYMNGVDQYDPDESIYLLAFLEVLGIKVS
ncbi:MAG: hypothetical protein EOO50_16310 [Flavobacterium sp.]|uniref:hypothetical protein n=1 Tax=Flavobacterium sp. TaxID=239 RepID=UPI001226DAE0|nr:hypothetical protein [Flavobacterium sp.]RZJ64211.1 MAG: hypothetical protein EOO50_16310 [Flavobacterium sp.]